MSELENPKLFSAYKVVMQNQPHLPDSLHAYLIESTAPENIDDKQNDNTNDNNKYKDKLIPINVDQDGGVIDEIADTLICSKNPALIISVHGFNSPSEVILPGFWDSFKCVHDDKYINNRDIVCIGYRWPSEAMFSPRHTIFKSSPYFLRVLFVGGVIFLSLLITTLISAWYEHFKGVIGHGTTIFIGIADPLFEILVTLFFLAIPVTLFLLRNAVYFRDGYRAASFGIPDLVEIIRQIDKKLAERSRLSWIGLPPRRVQLSFIAHSMGAYVVTSVVRILSDVFDPASVRVGLNSNQLRGETRDPKVLSKIGHAFRLKRLVLVSPDIPAEALISNRANFLSNSLSRFEEVFLFSNEGDEVLRQISTAANYFSFPTKSSSFGYRLGNVCLLDPLTYGINSQKFDQRYLEIGKMMLFELNKIIEKASGREDLAKRFSYFDCTDCVEDGNGVLTLAKRGHKIWKFDHFFLFLLYIYNSVKHDVHGGYFRSPFLKKLIYRLVCIGSEDTAKVYAAEGFSLHEQCKKHQVRVLLKS